MTKKKEEPKRTHRAVWFLVGTATAWTFGVVTLMAIADIGKTASEMKTQDKEKTTATTVMLPQKNAGFECWLEENKYMPDGKEEICRATGTPTTLNPDSPLRFLDNKTKFATTPNTYGDNAEADCKASDGACTATK